MTLGFVYMLTSGPFSYRDDFLFLLCKVTAANSPQIVVTLDISSFSHYFLVTYIPAPKEKGAQVTTPVPSSNHASGNINFNVY